MDTTTVIAALQDPMGLPFHPRAFQALLVLTFALHIAAVNSALGATGLSLWLRLSGGEDDRPVSDAAAKAATASVSAAILLGVAPLLFVQTLYDPFWYASNLLSAAWAAGFIVLMVAGYFAGYGHLLKGKTAAWGTLSLACYLLAGAVMHALAVQALAPDRWLGWYAASGGPDTSGTALHAFEPLRFTHFVVPAVTAAGLFLMLYAWYFRPRADYPAARLDRAARLGARLAFWSAATQAVGGFCWLLTVPADSGFLRSPVLWAAVLLGLGFVAALGLALVRLERPADAAVPAAVAALAVVLAMAAAREALRGALLARFAFTLSGHRVTYDWGSTALFLGSFVVGVFVLAWILTLAFQSGRVEGRFEPGPGLKAWGRASLAALVAWVVLVAGFGVSVTVRARGL